MGILGGPIPQFRGSGLGQEVGQVMKGWDGGALEREGRIQEKVECPREVLQVCPQNLRPVQKLPGAMQEWEGFRQQPDEQCPCKQNASGERRELMTRRHRDGHRGAASWAGGGC